MMKVIPERRRAH